MLKSRSWLDLVPLDGIYLVCAESSNGKALSESWTATFGVYVCAERSNAKGKQDAHNPGVYVCVLQGGILMSNYPSRMEASWVNQELERVRNIRPGFRWVATCSPFLVVMCVCGGGVLVW